MEVYVGHRHAVNAAFRLREQVIYLKYFLFYLFRNGHMVVHDMCDLAEVSVMMIALFLRRMPIGMLVPVLRLAFLLAVDQNAHMRAGNAAFDRPFHNVANAGDPRAVQFVRELLRLRKQLYKRRREHIARRAHAQIKIKRFHFKASIWLIMLARYPAPNPLSMLTTETPDAQELSIESSADSPPNDAP